MNTSFAGAFPGCSRPGLLEVNNGSGSGILVSEKGWIFQLSHVVDKQGTVLKIIMPDRYAPARKDHGAEQQSPTPGWLKSPPVLRKGLPGVQRTEKLPRVGDWVFALGHGGGLDQKRGPMVRLGLVVSLKMASSRRIAS